MSVVINAKGTSVSTFTIGKSGTIISQTGEITPPVTNDLIINLDATKSFIVDNGNNPGLITTGTGQDLTIQPDGNLYLNTVRWPTSDGNIGQILTTNGSGILSWTNPTPGAPNYELIISSSSQTVFNTTINTVANGSGKTYLQVFVNGIKQIEGASYSYTVTGSNQITFNSALIDLDEVEFISFA